MRVGIADHFGWAVAVTAAADHRVIDRRRLELVEPGVCPAPIHYEGAHRDLPAIAALVDDVRGSVARATAAALESLAAALPEPVLSIHLRALPAGFPEQLEAQLRPPWEARADALMYRRALADAAAARGWDVRFYDARNVEAEAAARLGAQADAVLHGPKRALGAPWTKDHRTALAATIVGSTMPPHLNQLDADVTARR